MQMKNWLDEFKLALINEDINKIENLLDNPNYENCDLEQINALTKEAIKLISQKKDELAIDINKAKLAKNYMKA